MPEKWKMSFTIVAMMGMIAMAMPLYAGVPDVTKSFYVPQRGTVALPTEGTAAAALFRMCPANDGGTSLANNARIKIVVRDVNDNGIPGIAAADICILFNGGTAIQGFSGVGADSIIANGTTNNAPLCPDIRCVQADDQTDATGTTYLTFTGATVGNPGVGVRNVQRRWGHYDSELPVYVLGFKISGRLTTVSVNGTYVLQIKNYDHNLGAPGGFGVTPNVGERVGLADLTSVSGNFLPDTANLIQWWRDFDSNGSVALADYTSMTPHNGHGCDTP